MSLPALAALLFALGAIDGATLLVRRLRGTNPHPLLASFHGLLVGAALVTLAIAVSRGERGFAVASLAVFSATALGGAALLAIHARGRLIPLGLVFVHGFAAAVGFALLVVHLLA
jgi:hypothetical protein